MKLFGFDIRRQSSIDKNELISFTKSLLMLNEECNKVLDVLTKTDANGNHLINGNTSCDLVFRGMTIKSCVDVYQNNKFSSPSDIFNLNDEVSKLRRNLCILSESIIMLEDIQHKLDEQEQGDDSDDDLPDDVESLTKCCITEMSYRLASSIMAARSILLITKYDIVRLAAGVDIIDEYYKRQKHKCHKSEFVIHFAKDGNKNKQPKGE